MSSARPHPRRRHLLAVALVTASVTVGCGDADDAGSVADDASTTTEATAPTVPEAELLDATGTPEIVIEVVDNTFEPRYVKVSPGTKVTFTNHGRNAHNVTPVVDGAFTPITADQLAPGATGSTVVDGGSGTVAYYCSIHGTPRNGQNGAFVVVAG